MLDNLSGKNLTYATEQQLTNFIKSINKFKYFHLSQRNNGYNHLYRISKKNNQYCLVDYALDYKTTQWKPKTNKKHYKNLSDIIVDVMYTKILLG